MGAAARLRPPFLVQRVWVSGDAARECCSISGKPPRAARKFAWTSRPKYMKIKDTIQ